MLSAGLRGYLIEFSVSLQRFEDCASSNYSQALDVFLTVTLLHRQNGVLNSTFNELLYVRKTLKCSEATKNNNSRCRKLRFSSVL